MRELIEMQIAYEDELTEHWAEILSQVDGEKKSRANLIFESFHRKFHANFLSSSCIVLSIIFKIFRQNQKLFIIEINKMQDRVSKLEDDNSEFVEKLKKAGEENHAKTFELDEAKKEISLLRTEQKEHQNNSDMQKKYEKLKVISKSLLGVDIKDEILSEV